MQTPTAEEQLALELINQLRMDPRGEYDRLINGPDYAQYANAVDHFGVDLNALEGQLNGLTAVAPLAWNANLAQAAFTHNQEMIRFDEQSHQLPGEPDIGQRATNAGYTNWTSLAENVYAFSSSVIFGHAGFVIDWGYDDVDYDSNDNLRNDFRSRGDGIQDPAGHRIALLGARYAEIGISIVAETNPNTDVGEQLVTHELGNRRNYNAQFLGVVIDDRDGDDFYDIGEGLGGVTITLTSDGGSFETTSWASGGWQIAVPSDNYTITFSGGALDGTVTRNATLGSQNVKIDVDAADASNDDSGSGEEPDSGGDDEPDGDDHLISGSEDNDSIIGTAEDDSIDGRGGDDTIRGGRGNDSVNGGAGADVIFSGIGEDIVHGGDGEEIINGGAGNDRLFGDDGADFVLGSEGDDIVEGNDGDDGLNGGAGRDTLSGGSGDDKVFSSRDDDRLFGDGGEDTLNAASGNDTLDGGDDDDLVLGSNGDDSVSGNLGNDSLNGGTGDDTLGGDDGGDKVFGGAGDDIVSGDAGNDTLNGQAGNDTVAGNAGDDLLSGKTGTDILTGGSGSDSFIFDDGDTDADTGSADRVTDFDQSQNDIIDLSRVDADSAAGGDQAFTLIGTAAFSGMAGELRYEQAATETLIFADTDGDAVADLAIRLDGIIELVSSDFAL